MNTISPAFSVRTSYKADVAGETPRIPSIYQIFSYSIRDCCSVLYLSFPLFSSSLPRSFSLYALSFVRFLSRIRPVPLPPHATPSFLPLLLPLSPSLSCALSLAPSRSLYGRYQRVLGFIRRNENFAHLLSSPAGFPQRGRRKSNLNSDRS